jgi:hypothetical protein
VSRFALIPLESEPLDGHKQGANQVELSREAEKAIAVRIGHYPTACNTKFKNRGNLK